MYSSGGRRMKTLERGPRKRGKKLYRFKQLLNFRSPFFIWRTRIDVEERRILSLAGFQITNVPKEKEDLWISKSKE
jgi:hypothetical protein